MLLKNVCFLTTHIFKNVATNLQESKELQGRVLAIILEEENISSKVKDRI